MNPAYLKKNKINILVHTGLMLVSMAGILGLLGWMIAGAAGFKTALILTVLGLVLTPNLPSYLIMRAARARPLHPQAGPALYRLTRTLAQRAGLKQMPALYVLPTAKLNAFAAGTPEDPAIGISQGLLRLLDPDEVAGILGHEIAHIRNNDMRVMAASALFGRLIYYLSLAGQFLMLVSLPMILLGRLHLPLGPFLFLVFAPGLSLFLHLALSRTREYNADLDSAALTGNPRALASALSRIEAYQKRVHPLRLFHSPSGQIMNTHPPTGQRIRRLMSLSVPDPETDHSWNFV
ncbi:zinc metalloprotease HtpX [Desulfospira joergensenii]|uniref:zinc metalloprotease HtpX n=1 Tax=Desulfospira joergensenii TaxID=53329 RepID=UPI0003B4CBC8|nr:zinc metalloprotease HtpX [Desulfospira joergensenii]